MGRGENWSRAQVESLLRLRALRAGWDEIAAETGRSVHSCRNKMSDLNLGRAKKRQRWTAANDKELLHLRDVRGLTWCEIDTHFGREHGSCSHKYNDLKRGIVRGAKPMGRPKNTVKPEPEDRVVHRRWSEEDMTLAAMRWRELFVDVYGESASREQRHLVLAGIASELKRVPSAVAYRLQVYGTSFGLNWGSTPIAPAQETKAMVEARHRHAAQLRQDPVAQMLGDPPPGYSALDQQRAAARSGAI